MLPIVDNAGLVLIASLLVVLWTIAVDAGVEVAESASEDAAINFTVVQLRKADPNAINLNLAGLTAVLALAVSSVFEGVVISKKLSVDVLHVMYNEGCTF